MAAPDIRAASPQHGLFEISSHPDQPGDDGSTDGDGLGVLDSPATGWGRSGPSPSQGLSGWIELDERPITGIGQQHQARGPEKKSEVPTKTKPVADTHAEFLNKQITSHANRGEDSDDPSAALAALLASKPSPNGAASYSAANYIKEPAGHFMTNDVQPRITRSTAASAADAKARRNYLEYEKRKMSTNVVAKMREEEMRRRFQALERLFTAKELELISTEFRQCLDEFEDHSLGDDASPYDRVGDLGKRVPFLSPEAVEQAYMNLGGDETGLEAVRLVVSELEELQSSCLSSVKQSTLSPRPHPYELFLNFCIRIKSTVGARGGFLNDMKRKNEEARARREAKIKDEQKRLRTRAIAMQESSQKKHLKMERMKRARKEKLQRAAKEQQDRHAKLREALIEQEKERALGLGNEMSHKATKIHEKLRRLEAERNKKKEILKSRSAEVAAAAHQRRWTANRALALERERKADEREQRRNARFRLITVVKQFTKREANRIKKTFAKLARPLKMEKNNLSCSSSANTEPRLTLLQLALALAQLGWSHVDDTLTEEDAGEIVAAVFDTEDQTLHSRGLDLVRFFLVCDALKKGTAGNSVRALSPRNYEGISGAAPTVECDAKQKSPTASGGEGGAFLRPNVSKVEAAQWRRKQKDLEWKSAIREKKEKLEARFAASRSQSKNREAMMRGNMIRLQTKKNNAANLVGNGRSHQVGINGSMSSEELVAGWPDSWLDPTGTNKSRNAMQGPVRPSTSIGTRRGKLRNGHGGRKVRERGQTPQPSLHTRLAVNGVKHTHLEISVVEKKQPQQDHHRQPTRRQQVDAYNQGGNSTKSRSKNTQINPNPIKSLSAAQLKVCRESFESFQKHTDGTVSPTDAKNFVGSFGIQQSTNLDDLITSVVGSGGVDWRSFLQIMVTINKGSLGLIHKGFLSQISPQIEGARLRRERFKMESELRRRRRLQKRLERQQQQRVCRGSPRSARNIVAVTKTRQSVVEARINETQLSPPKKPASLNVQANKRKPISISVGYVPVRGNLKRKIHPRHPKHLL